MKSTILLIISILYTGILLADIPSNNGEYDLPVSGFNYLPLVLGVLIAIGGLAFFYDLKKEKQLK